MSPLIYSQRKLYGSASKLWAGAFNIGEILLRACDIGKLGIFLFSLSEKSGKQEMLTARQFLRGS